MACSTPSTRPHRSAERVAHRRRGARASVTSSSSTSALGRQLAGRALGEATGPPGAGEHDLGALSCASWATPNASEASVSTPVITMRLPSSRPMVPPTVDAAATLPPAPGSRAWCARLRRCASASSAAPARRARRSAARLASVGYEVVDRLAVEVPGAWRSVDELVAAVARARAQHRRGDNDGAAGRRRRRDRHAVGRARRPTAHALETQLERQGRHLDGQRPRPGRPASSSRSCRRAARSPRTCRRRCRSCRVVAAFHHLPAKELGDLDHPIESDVLICSDDPDGHRRRSARSSRKIPGCARSTPASCRTRRRSRRSPPCCCSSTCATRPGSRRSSRASATT